MPERFTLTKKEREMMEVLWEAGAPLSRGHILEHAEHHDCSWKPNSIHIILNSMLEKGAVEVAGITAESRKLGRTFAPTVSREDYAVMQVEIAVLAAQEEAGLDPVKLLRSLARSWDAVEEEKKE